ncbi:MAG: hypothetical protein GAK31_00613 [Stenotrophomonas maltophilia]|uniref:BLUF domain-containing protein n=1 Tax=Stenotrophomonas maltophilia TaxID=40324 RepID=A0A7V8FJU4_STEMA|nr:MAG: hypothetical protein GAK31_00613 [Stenotrophomonas maltophilia]
MPLRAIAYASEASAGLDDAGVAALIEDAARFLQYIEGPADGIDPVYERILQASSHGNLVELSRGHVFQRLFPYWAMRCLPVEGALLRRLSLGDWMGFARRAGRDPERPTAVDMLSQLVQPLLQTDAAAPPL